MKARPLRLGAWVLFGGLLLVPGRVLGLEGRYIGSVTRLEGIDDMSNTNHSYDLSTAKSLSNQVDLDLRMSLRYQARLGQADSDLLGSRFYGDLRGSMWRLRGQLTPWQNVSTGPAPSRNRNAQFGFNLSPRDLPQFDLGYTRRDELTSSGRSGSDDRRATLSFGRGILQAAGSYRRVDRELRDSSTPGARTEEWKTSASAAPFWRGVTLRSGYEFLSTRYRSAARRRDIESHSVDLGGTWQPVRRATLSANGLFRSGTTTDNAFPEARSGDERSYGGQAGYRPWTWLDLTAGRDYRRTAVAQGNSISDYGQLQARARQRLFRRLSFQTGYQKYIDFADNQSVPADNVYAQVEGPVLRGLIARFEARTSTSGLQGVGRQWRQVAQLRGDPIPEMHIEAGWRHDALPDSGGPGLSRNEWSTTISFAPESALGLVANWKWQSAKGRIRSQERLANALVTWRRSDRSQLSFSWSRRRSTTLLTTTRETVYGLDLSTRLPGEYKVTGSARELSGRNLVRNRSYSLTLEKSF
jgi:hypothetical protein